MEHPENDDQYKGLKVNKGIADVPTVNPYIKKRAQRKVYTPSEFVEGILKGNITILSQAVTLVESSKHEHQQVAQEIIEKCSRSGKEYLYRLFRHALDQPRA